MLFALLVTMTLLNPEPAAQKDRFFDSAGLKLRYVEHGSGEAVLLIHGLSRDLDRNWVEPGLFEALAEKHRVIAFDLRGKGKSEKPESENDYGRQMVEDVARLMDHLQIADATLIGYSLGGRIALKFAALHPDRVKRLVLIGTGGTRTADDHKLWDTLAESLRRGDGIAPLAWQMWPVDQPAPTEEQLNAINERFLSGNDPLVLAAMARQTHELATSPDEVQKLEIPILASAGSVDRFRAELDGLKELYPKLQVTIVDGASHGNILDRTELKEAILAFLAE